MHISVTEGKFRVNAPLECWGCTYSHIYHEDKFRTYSNFPNKMEPDVAEHAKKSIQEYNQHNSAIGMSRSIQSVFRYGAGEGGL